MIKMLNAWTCEIDDADAAIDEILSQINLSDIAGHSAVGLLSCYTEFIETGVVRALCARLPFDILGCTTISSAVGGSVKDLSLCLSVLVSDDVTFSLALTDPLDKDTAPVADAYARARSALPESPQLALCFAPMIYHLGGELMLDAMNEASGGLPTFGTVACSTDKQCADAAVIYQGEAYPTRMAILLMSGNVHPRFILSTIPNRPGQVQKVTVTRAKGTLLYDVDGAPVMDYLAQLGLTNDDSLSALNTIPFLVDHRDGLPLAVRTLYLVLEDGSIMCGAAIPEGAHLAIGSLSAEIVRSSAQVAADAMMQVTDASCALVFSCLSRLSVLSSAQSDEMNLLSKALSGIPHHLCYSAGELCPVAGEDGHLVNRFHNVTVIGCLL